MVKLGWHDLFHRVNHLVVPMERRTDSKENFQAVSNIIAVIAIQFIRPMIDGELRAESDVYAIAMRKITRSRMTQHRSEIFLRGPHRRGRVRVPIFPRARAGYKKCRVRAENRIRAGTIASCLRVCRHSAPRRKSWPNSRRGPAPYYI